MAKVIERDGKFYRIRRGKEVEIPTEWVGKTVSKQTINKRPSKQPHKIRKELKHGTNDAKVDSLNGKFLKNKDDQSE